MRIKSLASRFLALCKSAAIVLAWLAFLQADLWAAATLLPNGKQCFSATTGTNGMVGTLGTIAGGSGGTVGTYGGVALTGGSGSGATANITVSGGAVTAVTILNPGSQYVVGDVLSAASGTIGSTAGFSVPVASVAINSSLAGGTVAFYTPNTLTFKQTWFNADQTVAHQNTNPVTLDANGCAVIYGTGSYRQILKDSLSNTVWDQVTTDTSANNNIFWAGLAGGTPNAITVVDPGFNATDGSTINFVATNTNTGSATLNPSSFGAIPIQKSTTSGPSNLTGGEITSGNIVSVIYSASFGTFTLVAIPPATGTTSSTPLCGATNLLITNDGSSPLIKMNITADTAVVVATSGAFINRSAVSVSMNMTVNGAGGLDQGGVGSNVWYDAYIIDNGTAPSALAVLATIAPIMPSGYSYKCRVGSFRVNVTGQLLRTRQRGRDVQYQVVAGSTTTAMPQLVTVSNAITGSVTVPTWISLSISTFVPPRATIIKIAVQHIAPAATAQATIVAPNSDYGPNQSATNPPPISVGTGVQDIQMLGELVLESTNIFWASDSSTGGAGRSAIWVPGWVDAVNAN